MAHPCHVTSSSLVCCFCVASFYSVIKVNHVINFRSGGPWVFLIYRLLRAPSPKSSVDMSHQRKQGNYRKKLQTQHRSISMVFTYKKLYTLDEFLYLSYFFPVFLLCFYIFCYNSTYTVSSPLPDMYIIACIYTIFNLLCRLF